MESKENKNKKPVIKSTRNDDKAKREKALKLIELWIDKLQGDKKEVSYKGDHQKSDK